MNFGNQTNPPQESVKQTAKQNIIAYSQSQSQGKEGGSPKSTIKKLIIIGIIIFIILTIIFSFIYLVTRSSEGPVNKVVELSYWGLWEDVSVANAIISDFELENPNIKVIYQKQDPKDYKEKLIARIEAGRGPDIFRFHASWYQEFSEVLLPLPNEVIEKEEFESNFYDVHQKDLIKNGAIYGIPLEVDTLALYINPKIIADVEKEKNIKIKLPTTWQEFIESSAILTKKDEQGKITQGGAGIGTYDNVNNAPDIISLLLAQNRVDFDNFEDSNTRVSDVLTFYTNFALVENNVWSQPLDSSLLSFSQGKLAMYFGFSRDYNLIKSSNPELSFKIIPAPQLLQDETFNIANYFAEGISLRSENQKEAFLFMEFLAREETQEKIYTGFQRTNLLPVPFGNKKLSEKLKGTESFVFVEQAKTAVSSPFANTSIENNENEGVNNLLKETVNSIISGMSTENATEALFQAYSQGFVSTIIEELSN